MRHFLLGFLITALAAAAPPPESLILDPREARQSGLLSRANIPYVLEYRAGRGALLLYGAEHVRDPDHPQVADIASRWAAFAPTVAFNEGGTVPYTPDRRTAAERGEAALLVHLAGQSHTPVATFEPPRSAEIAALRARFSDEQLALFYVLRLVRQESARGRIDSAEAVALDRLRLLRASGLATASSTITEFKAIAGRLLPDLQDWRQAPREWFSPSGTGRFTNEVAHASETIRNRHIFRLLVERARRGERVFAVIGQAHAVELEPALAAALGRPRSKQVGPSAGRATRTPRP
jgi:hypothetical protein